MEKLVSLGAVYHTPQHSREIKKRCDEVGVPAVLKIAGESPPHRARRTSTRSISCSRT